jgi:hypothetical protein
MRRISISVRDDECDGCGDAIRCGDYIWVDEEIRIFCTEECGEGEINDELREGTDSSNGAPEREESAQ